MNRRQFWELCDVEPRLRTLHSEVLTVAGSDLHPTETWRKIYGRLQDLVGWGAEREQLRNSSAYEIAYTALFDLWTEMASIRNEWGVPEESEICEEWVHESSW